MKQQHRIEQFQEIQDKGLQLFIQKNNDYGDSFATYGLIGVLVRIGDKMQRCITITQNQISLVDDEKIQDTLLDLHNYAAMALLLINDK